MVIENSSRIRQALAVLLGIVVLVFAVVPVVNSVRGHGKDYFKWHAAGRIVLEGGDIYEKDKSGRLNFMYPPTAAVLLAPLSFGGPLPLVVALQFVNAAAFVACIFMSCYLTTGHAFRQNLWLYLLPTALCLPYVWDNFLLGQPSILLLACMLGAFVCLQRKWTAGAAALIAFAASVKAFPILSLGYLVYRRNWKAVILTLLFLCVLLVLVPAPVRGFSRNLNDLRTWNDCMALHYEADSIAQRPDRGYSWRNQSLLAVANRLCRPVPHKGGLWVNAVDIPFAAVNVIIVAAGLALCLFYVGTMPAESKRTTRSDSIEYAMLLLLILMFTPLSFSYLYIWLLYPFMVALHACRTAAPASRERALLLTWLILCVLLYSFGLPWFRRAQALGNTFWACAFLVLGLGLLSRRVAGFRWFESLPGRAGAVALPSG